MASTSKFEYNDFGLPVVNIVGHCEVGVKAGFAGSFGDKHPLNYIRPVSGPAVQHVAEIQAALNAIEVAEAQRIDKLCIRTRSKFLRDSALDSMPKWRREGWSGCTSELLNDFQRLNTAMCRGKVVLQWDYFDFAKWEMEMEGSVFDLYGDPDFYFVDKELEMAKIGAQNYI